MSADNMRNEGTQFGAAACEVSFEWHVWPAQD